MHSPDNKPIIVVENLAARFGNNIVLENVSFQVYKGRNTGYCR